MQVLLRKVRVVLALLLTAGWATAGDQDSKDTKTEQPAVGKVSGKITLADGKPLPAGFLTFHGAGGSSTFRVNIDRGKYALSALPSGRYHVTVGTDGIRTLAENTRNELARLEGRGRLLKGAKADTADLDRRIKELKERVKVLEAMEKQLKDVKVSPKFSKRNTTPLRVTVQKGAQTIDIQLK